MREGMIILILVPTTVYAVCLVAQSCPTLCDPMDCSPPGSSVRGDSPGKNTGVGCRALLPPADLPHPGIKPRSPALQADSLPSEPPRKPKNTGVDSLSIIQGNFPTQESEPGSPALQADSLPAEPPGKHPCCSYFPSNVRGTCYSLRQIKVD